MMINNNTTTTRAFLMLVLLTFLLFLYSPLVIADGSTYTTTITSYTTVTDVYRAGLILINSMSLYGIDAYHKDFTVDNSAVISFANSALNVFAVPKTATCAYISTIIFDMPDIKHGDITSPTNLCT